MFSLTRYKIIIIGIFLSVLLLALSIFGFIFLKKQNSIQIVSPNGTTFISKSRISDEIKNKLKDTNWDEKPIQVLVTSNADINQNFTGGRRDSNGNEVSGIITTELKDRILINAYIDLNFALDKNEELKRLIYTGLLYHLVQSKIDSTYNYEKAIKDGFSAFDKEAVNGIQSEQIL